MVDLHRPMRANEIVRVLLRKTLPEIVMPMLCGAAAATKPSLRRQRARILFGRF
jgi:hypothetical protein